jgi:3'-phosphoadenosine 5'-phosphosulfate sulfotransferase (PAPS reductase)/FAD synthetase
MQKPLAVKVQETVRYLRALWPRLDDKHRFVAFSTGKDSLALTAMLYEAVEHEKPTCLYSHHGLEFSSNLDYLEGLKERGFAVSTVNPFLGYFDLMERGIGFLTRKDPWCVPMLVGTGILEWLQTHGAKSPREAVMFRGMSGSEYSHKFHTRLELYKRLDLPTFNPVLSFTTEEIIEVIRGRYGLPLNPIYEHMGRTYCICCYTSDARRQEYSSHHFPDVCARYYGQIENMLFDSGLLDKARLLPEHKTRKEKLDRHGFVHWNRIQAQNVIGAVKRHGRSGSLVYRVRDASWINTKHLQPIRGKWSIHGTEIRFWNLDEKKADSLVKRMINCLDCGFCVVECFRGRHFDRQSKTLRIDGCVQCGRCLRLTFCMGWRHRFWRRTIVEGKSDGT